MKRIIIDCGQRLIRSALMEDDRLIEIIIEDKKEASIVGNIYVGVVKNILPSEFAFINIGTGKNAFLYLSDPKEKQLYRDGKLLLKRGQELPVQVLKDATGTKGAYVTSDISVAGRFVVVYKKEGVQDISVSKKIEVGKEKSRLKKLASEHLPGEFSAIIRTNAQDREESEIIRELSSLTQRYDEILKNFSYQKQLKLLYESGTPMQKSIKELYQKDVDEIIINSKECLSSLKLFMDENFPEAAEKVILYNEDDENGKDIFCKYFIEAQIGKALEKRVNFGGGGFLFIEQTEACVVIDVNSGSFIGNKNHEESVLRINLEAAREIAKELRLRNLSGIIIVDFVDMKLEENREILKEFFENELKKDRISTTLSKDVVLGLYCLTRKKTREPLSAILMENCDYCHGTGMKRKKFEE